MRPKKSQLLPLALGLAALGAYFIFGKSEEAPPATPAAPPAPAPGAGDHVLQTSGGLMNTHTAQSMLKSLGPAAGSATMASLIIDGAWGPSTRNAIIAYRSIKGSPGSELDPPMAQTLAGDFNRFVQQGGTPAT